MAKLILNTIGSRYGSIDSLNDNFDAIEQALENTLSRDGTSPNAMEADLDMNNNDILNTKNVFTNKLFINGQEVAPSSAVILPTVYSSYEFIAFAGQTVFSIAPYNANNSNVSVYVNGLMLPPSDVFLQEYNVIIPPLSLGDEVYFQVFLRTVLSTDLSNEDWGIITTAVTFEDDYGTI